MAAAEDAVSMHDVAEGAESREKQFTTGDDIETEAASSAGIKKKKKKKKKKIKKASGDDSTQVADVFVYDDRGTFSVTQDTVSGRCVVASRDLVPGELVLAEAPFAKVTFTANMLAYQLEALILNDQAETAR